MSTLIKKEMQTRNVLQYIYMKTAKEYDMLKEKCKKRTYTSISRQLLSSLYTVYTSKCSFLIFLIKK